MKSVELAKISVYRKELMGISAIMILICHAPGNGIEMPKFLEYILVQGQIGVDLFLFLSGMGLWFSLSKFQLSHAPIYKWYKNRFIKLLVPYLVIQGLLSAVHCLQDESDGFLFWLSTVSTIEFWISHRAAWFIALLIPLYLIAPLLYTFLKKNKNRAVILLIVTYFMALFPLNWIGVQEDNQSFLYNLQFVMIRVPSFILGMYMGPLIKRNAVMEVIWFLPMLMCSVAMFALTRTPIDTYMFLIFPLMYFFIFLLSIKDSCWFNKVCRFFGDITLESYLWNGLRIIIIPLMTFFCIPDYNNLVMYSLVLIFGTLLSFFCSKMFKPIILKLTNKCI